MENVEKIIWSKQAWSVGHIAVVVGLENLS